MKSIVARIALAVLASFLPLAASAHGGGLDKNGCHTNRKTGDYHCHNGRSLPPSAPIVILPQEPVIVIPDPLIDNTCHTGPRGGRYRIINGRKRYGC